MEQIDYHYRLHEALSKAFAARDASARTAYLELADPEAFRRIRSYSPYDNVTARDYPHILVTAGLTDPRVTYWEPAKWVARLRATMTGGGPVLLHTNMDAGHAGAAGRFDSLKEVALAYAFAIQAVNGGWPTVSAA